MKSSSARTLILLALMIIAVTVLASAITEEITREKPEPISLISELHYEDRININTADSETLMTLNGIGEVKAKAIIEFRTKNGRFATTEDIMRVDGIGMTLFEKIKDEITV